MKTIRDKESFIIEFAFSTHKNNLYNSIISFCKAMGIEQEPESRCGAVRIVVNFEYHCNIIDTIIKMIKLS